ncbi:membrane protein DedA, SNARE-associated domain [Rathayibacter oskolensis]|uniref:Membrane protein DedA, SNARE-associated domain n=1 Tax=Rathayibacter oskolensis TaxID=1891671 RepID=A0A1X7ND26_9MICO|nr:DedA family protein [Rathayibacter oskolensis]SMH35525.1 membrane protein DedA, SNARE-associated domain [Rathayibacter oskolensis]
MNDALTGILDFVVGVPPVWRTLLAGLAIFFETTILAGLIVPGDTVVIVSATGVTTPLQFVALAVTVIVGALCGESVGFYLGRWFGPRIRASRLGRRLGEKNWLRAERYLARRGGIAVFLSRFLPVLHSLIPLTVGMSGMRYRTFIAWTTPACILWSFAYVGVGAAAAGGYRELSDSLHYAGYLFVAVIVVFALLVLAGKKLVSRAEARHLDE